MKIFKAGKYPQGIFTKSDLKKMIEGVKSVPGILGHTSGWKELKVPVQAIPIAAEFNNLRINGDYIEADPEVNEFGKKFIKGKAIQDVSVEIRADGKLAKVGMLGAVPPQIKDLDSLTSLEFDNQEDYIVVEFEEEKGEEMTLKELLEKATLEEKLDALKLIGESITPEQKKAFRAVSYEFAEPTKDEIKEFAEKHGFEIKEKSVEKPEEVEARIRKELTEENKVKEFCEKAKLKIIPAFHGELEAIAKELIKKNEEIEFSEGNKGQLFNAFEKIVLEQKDILPDKTNFEGVEFGENEIDDVVARAKQQYNV